MNQSVNTINSLFCELKAHDRFKHVSLSCVKDIINDRLEVRLFVTEFKYLYRTLYVRCVELNYLENIIVNIIPVIESKALELEEAYLGVMTDKRYQDI